MSPKSFNDANSERVSLALGDGGAATQRFLRQEVLSRFANPALADLEDGALVAVGGANVVVTTDSFVVDPPIFPGGDIGRLAVCGAVNDLVASGAEPHVMTLGMVISEGFPLKHLRRILDSVADTASTVGVRLVAGDTKVIGAAGSVGICLHTTALGVAVRPGCLYRMRDAQVDDRVLVSGTIGEHALAVISQREGLGFERRVVSDCTALHELILPLVREVDGIHALRDPTRGGLAGVLHDLAEAGVGDVVASADHVPILEEVRYGCEMLGLDPLDLINEGKMVLVVAPDAVDEVLMALRRHPLGRRAALIGEIRHANDRAGRVILQETRRQRLLIRHEGQAMPRLC